MSRAETHEIRHCGLKCGYVTQSSAKSAAAALAKQLQADITHYKCRYCGRYHIGHTPKWVREKIRNEIKSRKGNR